MLPITGTGFVKGKRSSRFFAISKLDGINVTNNCIHLSVRRTTLMSKEEARLLPGLKARFSAA
jgi:hypothetical protein